MISGFFGLKFACPMPALRVSVHLPKITNDFVAIDFLLDTGATNTLLHPQDAMFKVSISPSTLARPSLWSNRETVPGIGGSAEYYVWPAVYAFHHDDGQMQQHDGEIRIAQTSTANSRLPSLLGWDVLRYFRIDLDFVGQEVKLR